MPSAVTSRTNDRLASDAGFSDVAQGAYESDADLRATAANSGVRIAQSEIPRSTPGVQYSATQQAARTRALASQEQLRHLANSGPTYRDFLAGNMGSLKVLERRRDSSSRVIANRIYDQIMKEYEQDVREGRTRESEAQKNQLRLMELQGSTLNAFLSNAHKYQPNSLGEIAPGFTGNMGIDPTKFRAVATPGEIDRFTGKSLQEQQDVQARTGERRYDMLEDKPNAFNSVPTTSMQNFSRESIQEYNRRKAAGDPNARMALVPETRFNTLPAADRRHFSEESLARYDQTGDPSALIPTDRNGQKARNDVLFREAANKADPQSVIDALLNPLPDGSPDARRLKAPMNQSQPSAASRLDRLLKATGAKTEFDAVERLEDRHAKLVKQATANPENKALKNQLKKFEKDWGEDLGLEAESAQPEAQAAGPKPADAKGAVDPKVQEWIKWAKANPNDERAKWVIGKYGGGE